ncbi:MAG: YitT family protein [Fusobacterium sp.]|nr:YitT family protein [Fusobacterium sp.]
MINKYLKLLKEYSLITIGCIIVAFSMNYFYLGNNLAQGGLSGICLTIYYLTKIEVSYLYILLNIPLLILGYKFLGKNFIYKTIYGAITLTIFLKLFSDMRGPGDDILIGSIYAGALTGIGVGLIFFTGGSSGGMDIVAKIINKYYGIPIGKIIFTMDCFILSGVAIILGRSVFMYTLISVVVCSKVIDLFQAGMVSARGINIITKKPDIITKRINEEAKRGATIINGIGGYTKGEVTLVYCVAGKYQLVKIKNIVKEEDPEAFMTIGEVHEVMGKGFIELD